ncbi:RagB/SusD family nutrient uptake outer membrane protein [Zunongwangia sp. HRR-M8]|uniref:RagB/SusD family nutrient uptake outer membrane protein n=1 Tax=Zunongwangia sp. HRR-M8 TaxID=3015170 RepID=UPI0022DE58BB|nr:RagB/SusD family nutrient uptake outer membrane protein [Zunongwangia sp. HRR-M8]WBL23357.1 RagB/SusD family nutrient uptake outer membrane protein [Zunongwangia sp. HRR-M8]
MKSLNIIILVMSAMLILSCNDDFLDKNPPDTISTQNFWTSQEDVETALAGVYYRLQENFLGYERVYLDGLTDNAFLDPGNSNQSNLGNVALGNISANLGGAIPNMYETPYRVIVACNYFLDNIDKAPIEQSEILTYRAEVRFIRALAYFDLVRTFGGVIIYRDYPQNLEEVKIAKSTVQEVYSFIQEDLQFAIDNLPRKDFQGHAVKGSANSLMGRVLITQEKFGEALPYLKAVIDSEVFGLANNYKLLFLTNGQIDPSINKEIIFATQYLSPNNPQRIRPGAGGHDVELGWYSLLQPYKDLVDSYEMIDGKLPENSAIYNPNNPYENRDPRLDMTIKLPNEIWKNNQGEVWDGSYNSYTGFLTEKYVDLSKAPFTSSTAINTDQDYIHIRYADVLLMFAEAQNEVNGPNDMAYNTIDEVRNRPGVEMPPVDRTRYNTKEELRNYIRRERRVELALEGIRYNDLKRWKIAEDVISNITNPLGQNPIFRGFNYLMPFPQSELDNNTNLVQNPGY